MNAYLQKREIERNVWINASRRIAEQFMIDTFQIALNESDGYGYDKIMRLTRRWEEIQEELRPALIAGDPEADVCQEHIDRVLTRIINGKAELIPWEERYPELKRIKYGR